MSRVARGRLADLPLTIGFWDGSVLAPQEPAHSTAPHRAPTSGARTDQPRVLVRDPRAVAHLLHEPNQLGLARAWVAGLIDLEGDLEPALAVRRQLDSLRLSRLDRARLLIATLRLGGLRMLRQPAIPAVEARPQGVRHSLRRDRAAISYHYDVSNRFYRQLLGPSMVYSCAYFTSPDDTLEAAQERKLDVICRKLRLAAGERLLDVGCGWGSLLIYAASHYGVRGVGVTLSVPQAELARERIAAAGLAERVEIRVADYREVADGPYDKIVSVGMYEHVGRRELDTYARTIHRLLRRGGLFLNHGIARLYSEPPGPKTFISRYVFPDGELHPVTDVMAAMRATGLEVRDVESLREHYALTLRCWLANLVAGRELALDEIGAERERICRLYTLASALAFEGGDITIYQVLAARDGAPHGLPLDRRELLLGAGAPAPVASRPAPTSQPTRSRTTAPVG